jgi:predicted RNase H-like HicB family nuclease
MVFLYFKDENFILGETMLFKGTAVVWREEDWYVAKCAENDIASQGHTLDEAIANLKEALALYYEDEEEEIPQYGDHFMTPLEVAF